MSWAAHQFRPPDEPSDKDPKTPPQYGEFPKAQEDLPYKVELWDETGRFVEQIVAMTLSPAIGYAAYYAATREHPGRLITLRHKASVISRWTGKAN